MTDTEVQRFKISVPIIKTSVKIVKDEDGNEVEERYVEGVASGTELDKHGDRMAPSAIDSMAKSLKQHVINLNNEHDTSWSGELGDITKLEISEDDDLEIAAKLNEMSSAKDLWYALTDQNKKLGLSIGGYVKDYEMVKEGEGDDAKWVRLYKKIELDHIAVTSRPAYPKAWVSVISKSINAEQDNELITKIEMEEIQKPYPNEHSCRLKDPGKYDTCRRGKRSHNGKQYSVVFCKKTGGKMEEQSYRYNKKTWSVSEARAHCKSHNGTFEAARSGEKSAEDDEKLLKKEENEEKSRTNQNERKLRELARAIARSIQKLEGDLLLELVYKGLSFLNENQILLLERSLDMAKDVSLEAKEAKKKADAEAKPEGDEDETLAAPENGESEGDSKVEEEPKDEEKAKDEDETEDEENGEDEEDEESAEDKSEDKSGEGEEEEDEEEENGESEEDEEEDIEDVEESEKEVEVKASELLKTINQMSEDFKKVLKSNEKLAKKVKELESQPADRKGAVEVTKQVGDDDDEEAGDAEALKKERDEKIERVKKEHKNDANLFARIQRIRSEYSLKAQELSG